MIELISDQTCTTLGSGTEARSNGRRCIPAFGLSGLFRRPYVHTKSYGVSSHSWIRRGCGEDQARGRAAHQICIPGIVPFKSPSSGKPITPGIVMDSPASISPAPTSPTRTEGNGSGPNSDRTAADAIASGHPTGVDVTLLARFVRCSSVVYPCLNAVDSLQMYSRTALTN